MQCPVLAYRGNYRRCFTILHGAKMHVCFYQVEFVANPEIDPNATVGVEPELLKYDVAGNLRYLLRARYTMSGTDTRRGTTSGQNNYCRALLHSRGPHQLLALLPPDLSHQSHRPRASLPSMPTLHAQRQGTRPSNRRRRGNRKRGGVAQVGAVGVRRRTATVCVYPRGTFCLSAAGTQLGEGLLLGSLLGLDVTVVVAASRFKSMQCHGGYLVHSASAAMLRHCAESSCHECQGSDVSESVHDAVEGGGGQHRQRVACNPALRDAAHQRRAAQRTVRGHRRQPAAPLVPPTVCLRFCWKP
eukprot:1264593-Rhodomonas_salina.7